jgi:hypothetical protein
MEMLHYITETLSDSVVMRSLEEVLVAFLAKHRSEVGYSEEVFDLAVFLLCFCSPASAFELLSRIYTFIVP